MRNIETYLSPRVLKEVRELKEFIDVKGMFDKKSFLSSFIETIEADDDKMKFNYALLLPPGYTRQETVSVSRYRLPSSTYWVSLSTRDTIYLADNSDDK